MNCPHCGSSSTRAHQNRQRNGVAIKRMRCLVPSCGKTWTVTKNGTQTTVGGADEVGTKVEDDGYEKHASVGSGEVRPTEEHLRDELKIPADWICTHFQGRAWPSGEKQMYYGRASFIPRHPEKCEWPTVRPVQIKPLAMKRSKDPRPGPRRAIIACDAQIGFFRDFDTFTTESIHDQAVFALLNSVIVKEKPDVLVLAGDMLDLPDWSDHFVQGPEFAFTSQIAMNWFASWLRFIRPYCGRVVYLYGNHEARMERNIVNNTASAYRLKPANMPDAPPALSIESILGLEAMGIEYITEYPQGEFWLNSNLRVIHGQKIGAKSGQTAMKMLDGARASVMQGHVHRQEQAHVTTHSQGKTVTYGAYSMPTMARLDGAVPGSTGRDNWQQGFTVVDYTKELFQVHPINIWGRRMIYFGEEYSTDVDPGKISDDEVRRALKGIGEAADFARKAG